MTTGDWVNLLNWWSDEVQKVDDKFAWFYGHRYKKSIFEPDESPEMSACIQKIEERLGKTLPPSYRDFLTVGGAKFEATHFYFRDIEKMDRFSQVDPQFFERWEFQSDAKDWPEKFPNDYNSKDYGQVSYFTADQKELLQNMVRVNWRILLNPAVSTPEGEWEAWQLHENNPFITKYRSFYDLMLAAYEDYTDKTQALWLEPERIHDRVSNKTSLVYPWQPFLRKWSEFLFKPGIREELFWKPDYLEDDNYDLANLQLVRPPVSEAEIEAAEARLSTAFPPSYRQFLKVSNGLPVYHQNLLLELFPLNEIKWSRDDGMDRNYWESDLEYAEPRKTPVSDEEYYDYFKQDKVAVRLEHAEATLLIGDYDGNDYYLLNPLAVNEDGEWEAWTFYHEDGVQRYSSFWDMFQETYYRLFSL